jgi:DNA-binding NtrC family response regulator/tetratricopeptide (TPR) repeat protein
VSLLGQIVGESPEIVAVRERITRLVARASDVRRLPPVLIQGETGSGKGLVARALHRAGPRSGGPFVEINCAAIPEALLEAEMFGFERGAFTDARQAKRGLFQTAHRGTLFLDEIGLLPESLQAKLLTVLEERTVRRLGATQSEPVDVWIIAATNLDLLAATRAGRFREDLYHRLAVLTLVLPPLRERQGDIPLLAEHFLARACADYGLAPKTLAPDARAALAAYPWPGNVRELINAMERVALLAEASLVTADLLGLPDAGKIRIAAGVAPEGVPPPTLAAVVDRAERAHLLEALEATAWNVSRAAARLGISRNTIRYRIEKHDLRPGAPAPPRRARRAMPPRIADAVAPPPPVLPPASVAVARPPAPSAIRWERRRLAILQAMLASDRDAGPLDTGRVIETLVEKIRSFGGRVEELGSGGFVALFGLEPVEDAVRRAALAAIAMQRAAQHAPDGGSGPGLRIGVDLGSFLLSRLPDASLVDTEDKRTALRAVAALLEGTEPGSVVVSAAAAPFLARGFELTPVGAAPGRRSAFRLGGLERGEPAAGRRTRFVGRRHELDLLRNRLDTAVRGQGQVVAIAGEAGIGKSRLVIELRRGLAAQEVLCLEGHCLPYGTPFPGLPLVELLRAACAIVETDEPDGVRDKLRATLDRAGMDALEATPYLVHLLDPGEGGVALAQLSPEVVKARTFETLRELSRRLSDRAPLVLVVEDLQWVDRISEEYLTTLVEVVARARILLVTTHRPGYRPPWIDKSYATQIALQPLSPRESQSLVLDVIGPAEVDEPTVELIVAKAEGNPFFAEELARAVTERGSPTPGSAAPDTVEGVLMARIDRLATGDKRVLQAAAVIGRSLPFLLLQAILDPPDDALRERLARLQGAEFLYETRVASELEYTFKHMLTHEVAYASLLPEQRRALHARIVDGIERLYPERHGEQIDHLAYHAFRGEAWAKAAAYLREAGSRAAARSAHREAAAWFGQALAALDHLPQDHGKTELALDLRFELKTALTPLAEWGQIFECLREAERLATLLDDQPRLGRVSAYASDCSRVVGRHEHAIELGRRALTIAQNLRDTSLEVNANTYLAMAHYARGGYREASGFLWGNVTSVVGELLPQRFEMAQPPSVHSRAWLACCLAELGDFDEAVRIGEEGLRIAASLDGPLTLGIAHFGLGQVRLKRGDFEEAIRELERGLELTRKWRLQLWYLNIAEALGSAYARSGRVSLAVSLLEEVVQSSVTMKRQGLHSVRVAALGEACLLAGRLGEATELARHALDLAREHKEEGSEAWALHLLADIRSRSDASSPDRARDDYESAIAMGEARGMRPLVARCHLGLGRLYRRTGDRGKAEAHLSAAAALFRAMATRAWLQEAEEERSRLP